MTDQEPAGTEPGTLTGFLDLIARVIARNILNEREGPSLARENPEGPPNTPETVLVQGKGKERARKGPATVLANPEHPHPARTIPPRMCNQTQD